MKIAYCFLLACFIFLPAFRCEKEWTYECHKARLAVKGQCMNYTIKILEGKIDTNAVEAFWINPVTGISYQNVFRLDNICDFPDDIDEGEEFYFVKTVHVNKNCAVCLAAYPTPGKGMSIAVSKQPCP